MGWFREDKDIDYTQDHPEGRLREQHFEDYGFAWDMPIHGNVKMLAENPSGMISELKEKATRIERKFAKYSFKDTLNFDPDKMIQEVENIEKAMEENPNFKIDDERIFFAKKLFTDSAKEGIYIKYFDPNRFKLFADVAEAKYMLDGSDLGIPYATSYHAKRYLLDHYTGEFGTMENLTRYLSDIRVQMVDDIYYDETKKDGDQVPMIVLADCLDAKSTLFPNISTLEPIRGFDMELPEDEYVSEGYPRDFIQSINNLPPERTNYTNLIQKATLAWFDQNDMESDRPAITILDDGPREYAGDY